MKKTNWTFAIIIVTALAVAGCTAPTGAAPTPHLGLTVKPVDGSLSVVDDAVAARSVVAEFRVGSLRSNVFDTLGDPDFILIGNDSNYTPGVDYDADAYHVYEDVGLSFRIFGDTVREITLLNADWIASNGLIVGMTPAQMIDVLGSGFEVKETEFKDFYTYSEFAISAEIYHSSGLVEEINIQEGNLQ